MPISINCMYLWVKAPHMTSSRKSDLTCSLDITGTVRGDPGSTTSCLDSLVVLVLEPCGAGEDGAVGGMLVHCLVESLCLYLALEVRGYERECWFYLVCKLFIYTVIRRI